MADNDQLLEKFGKLIEPLRAQLYEQGANIVRVVKGQERIEKEQQEQGKDIKEVKADVKNLELKVAVIQTQNNKDHSEIMDMLAVSNDVNYQVLKEEVKKLEDRISHLEKQAHGSKN